MTETDTEDISDAMIKLKNQIEHRRKYQREYYHAHSKKPSSCEFCEKIFSSKSALIRHKSKNMKCEMLRIKVELESVKTSNS